MHAALVLGGRMDNPEPLRSNKFDLVVAADSGAKHCFDVGVTPHAVLGDMDSLGAALLATLEREGVELVQMPRHKDLTDGEIALTWLLAKRPTRITLLAAHGGRTAMVLSNLKLLRTALLAGVDARMRADHETITFLEEGQTLELRGGPNQVFNLVPTGGDATVTSKGGTWELSHEVLGGLAARGVSNRFLGSTVHLTCHEGSLIVVVEDRVDQI